MNIASNKPVRKSKRVTTLFTFYLLLFTLIMLLFTFEKTGPYTYVPHVDMLRAVNRTLRRAGIECAFSQGFNPHILLFFSPPLPVGTGSCCEQCAVQTDISADEFMERYNRAAPIGLKAAKAEVFAYNVNPASAVRKAMYEIKVSGIRYQVSGKGRITFQLSNAAREIMAGDSFTVKSIKEGKETVKEARPFIHDINVSIAAENADDKGISNLKDKNNVIIVRAVLSAGQENLRADRFIEALLEKAGIECGEIEIVRAALYN